jgi:L-aminopeptidase/D-esterase-like protein
MTQKKGMTQKHERRGEEATGNGLHPRPDLFNAQELMGSIIIVAATDARLMPHLLKRIARRLTMGVARTGSVSGNGSGDLFIVCSTGNSSRARRSDVESVKMLRNLRMDPLFTAAVQATEEAIANALVAVRTHGRNQRLSRRGNPARASVRSDAQGWTLMISILASDSQSEQGSLL